MTLDQVLVTLRTGVVQVVAKYGFFEGENCARLTIISPTGATIPDELMQGIRQHQAILYLAALHSYTTICPAEAEHRPDYRWVPDWQDEDLEYQVCDVCVTERQAQLAEMDKQQKHLYN